MFMLSICEAREIIKSLKKDYGLYHFVSGDKGLKRDKISLLEKFLINNNLTQEETINELLHNQN